MERTLEACTKKKDCVFLSVFYLKCSPEINQHFFSQPACADGVCEIKGFFSQLGSVVRPALVYELDGELTNTFSTHTGLFIINVTSTLVCRTLQQLLMSVALRNR
jgi:hypothetical protein